VSIIWDYKSKHPTVWAESVFNGSLSANRSVSGCRFMP